MRVVVTRPDHSGQKTAARLKALGHQVITFPLSRPIHHPAAIRKGFATHSPASLAITSAEAIHALEAANLVQSQWQLPILTVGEASAKAAADFGFDSILTANGYATGMIDLLASLSQDQRSKLSPMLYLGGRPRGSTFEDGLLRLGIHFSAIDAYTMEKLTYRAKDIAAIVDCGAPDAILFFSSEAVRDYFSQMHHRTPDHYFRDTKLLCISDKVASELPDGLQSQSTVSKSTSEQGIIDILLSISGT